jgi:hypothetical protein
VGEEGLRPVGSGQGSRICPEGPARAAAEGEDLTEVASAAVLEILAENPDGVAKAQLPALLFKKLASHPKKAQIMQVPSRMSSCRRVGTYDKGKLSL